MPKRFSTDAFNLASKHQLLKLFQFGNCLAFLDELNILPNEVFETHTKIIIECIMYEMMHLQEKTDQQRVNLKRDAATKLEVTNNDEQRQKIRDSNPGLPPYKRHGIHI